ncbi:MAG: ComEC/Rec2 family competence protein, partial [Alphaproteobacteria bacterium]|nr:ComEC/Rec2 family competence protein [Alphaproteobacteria bacterium]
MRKFLRFLSFAPDPAVRRRLELWMPVCFVIGIIIYFRLKTEPDYQLALTLTAMIWLLVWVLVCTARRQILVLLVLALAFALSGFSMATLRSHWLAAPLVTEKRGPVRLSGRVIQIEQRDYGQRVTMDHLWYDNRPDPAMPDRLRLTARKDMMEGIKIGDWMRAVAVVTPIAAPYYPGGFDYQRYLYFIGLTHGIGGTGFILKPPRPMHAPKSYQSDILIKIQLLRARIRDQVFQNLDGDRAAITTALIAGDQSNISGKTMQAMRDSGLAHILSISGLHIGMMGLITLFLLRAAMSLIPPLVLNYNIKIWALAVAVIPVTFYSILAGLDQVPVLRSLVMSLMILVGLILGRRNFSLRVVGIAALICMLAFPDQLLGASLQMSFAAVIGLLAIGQTAFVRQLMAKARQAGWGHRLIFGIGAALLTSVVATLATSPSSAYSFNRVAIYGFVSNLLVIPATDFIMIPCVALSLLLMPFGLEAWVLKLFGASIDYMIWVAKWTASLPGA